jgi:hypothetical protein
MTRKLLLSLLFTAAAFDTAAAGAVRRRASTPRPFPPCSMISGTAAVTFTHDDGRTLAPSAETLSGVGYTYGLTALDQPNTLMAWHKRDLLLTNDAGCSWRVVGSYDDWDFPPSLTAGRGGRVYIWSDNRLYLRRYDVRGVTKLKPPVAFVGLGVNREDGNHLRAGGDDGTVWDSTDGGETWQQVGSLKTVTSPVIFYRFAFDPADLDHIVAGTTVDGSYYTYDGGRNWRRSTGYGPGGVNAFQLVVSPVDGDVVWAMALEVAQTDVAPAFGRHIYGSVDGGATFRAVVDHSPAVTLVNGPTMAAHPRDANVLYFVFGTRFQGYGTDVFRYDADSKSLTMTHNDNHDVNAIAFSPVDPTLMYLGLEVESGVR